ncbi:MAG TPA: 3-keto-5-aminohexanoate cleavage protein [Candidatus Dormibacteraeota bacterium]
MISAALTGVLAKRDLCPAIPYTPAEIGEEAARAAEAGAAIVHIHARTDEGGPDWSVERFRAIFEEVRARTDVIVNFSTGAVGIPKEDRIAHIRQLKPELAALNMGSMNYALFSKSRREFVVDHVFANPFGDIRFFLEAMNEGGVRPEMECFDSGHIGNTAPLIELGILQPPYQFSLVMGVLGGIPGTTRNLVHQAGSLPAGSHWQVIGIGLNQWPLLAAGIALGGNVRVGLEDNFYLEEGHMARSNGELVTKAVLMCRQEGREPASAAEARRLLGLPAEPRRVEAVHLPPGGGGQGGGA